MYLAQSTNWGTLSRGFRCKVHINHQFNTPLKYHTFLKRTELLKENLKNNYKFINVRGSFNRIRCKSTLFDFPIDKLLNFQINVICEQDVFNPQYTD